MDEVSIIVDYREMRTNVVKKLYELGAKIESKNLAVGDFILSERVCVERKSVKDFLQSIIDNRLFEQVSNLVANFEKPLMIVEGIEDIAQREQLDLKKKVSLRGEKKPYSDKLLQEYIVTSLPGIGRGIAQNMLKKFKTVERIFTAKEKDLIVIADAKRNDIGSTCEAYAEAFLGEIDVFGKTERAFSADALTVTPYLGSDGIKPFLC